MVFADPIALPRPGVRPRPLRLPDLLQTTDLAADAVLQGRYNHLLPASGLPEDQRWFARIHGDERLDIWLISWAPGHPTELHDHGDSLGALTVLSGALDEFHWNGRELTRRRLDAGDQAAFTRGWVHDVVWAPPASGPEPVEATVPTLSVHAYSPPLVEMTYYDVAPDHTLRRQRTELTQHPEAS
ncbi:cysteine dioxygenase [Mycolicibacter nonchromogenicus]|uniref:Cysteine dioxygenase n=1 Tax=Mycolicibacter nonchromogenicus TaxID=1782 RepID=A0A1X1ZLV8_MYCNO|nr:cysteine dioxygenase [Mycolicibacter nonchromogenicus]OBI02620.1 cysteine dioxygenase [Mycolicibacter heraklionensis]ORW24101.1 cysteine dioxygenase [Mycolicibacter nonchromogenicus]